MALKVCRQVVAYSSDGGEELWCGEIGEQQFRRIAQLCGLDAAGEMWDVYRIPDSVREEANIIVDGILPPGDLMLFLDSIAVEDVV